MKNDDRSFLIGRIELVILMASLMALNALAIDVMLPALGLIAHDYGLTDDNSRQWIVNSYIYGMAIGSILYGSLADRYGRKPVLLVTIAIYIAFALLCAAARQYELLLIARFAQGLGAAAMGVLVNSIIRDRYEGDAMAQMMSTITMIFMIVPVLAPLFGQMILLVAPWKAIFLILAAAGLGLWLWVLARLPETLDPANRTMINPKSVAAAWRQVALHRNSIGHIIASGLMMAPLFAYLAAAQQIFFDIFDAGDIFVYLFALNAIALALANFTNARIVIRFGARRVSQVALLFFIAASSLHFLLAEAGYINIWLFCGLLVPSIGMIGFTATNLSAIAMQPFAHVAGVASSLQSFVRIGISGGLGSLIGLQFDGTVLPLASGFLYCGLGALLLILWAERGRLFRRVHSGARPIELRVIP